MTIEIATIPTLMIRQQPETANDNSDRKLSVLTLSSSLLTDRMLLYTGFLETLCRAADVKLWTMSARQSDATANLSATMNGAIEPMPEIKPFKEFPYNYLRRLNDLTWDFRLRSPSRMSKIKHQPGFKNLRMRALKPPARLLAALGVETILENRLEQVLLNYPRSPEAERRLRDLRPDILLTTGTFRYEEPAIYAEARKLGIPSLAFITSWDNVSTKNRMVFKYDGYLVWSERMKQELHEFFPYTKTAPMYVVGAPQFDVFFQPRFHQSREEFCAEQGLRPDLPIILYALGSPNFLKEHHGAIYLAEQLLRGELGEAQMLVRPHPLHDNGREARMLSNFGDRVVVQRTGQTGTAVPARSQDEKQIKEWINTFRHADVVINLSSTVAIDAAIFDKPVVNLDYDPQPSQADQQLIEDINHRWTHFKPIAESGGVWLTKTPAETLEAVQAYLKHPELHRERRRWMAEFVCGFLDGRCGERMAESLLEFTSRFVSKERNR
ncbi:MAG: CDP-glycerol glycerophosphotransferase family protein [Acidobacteriota bacterium]|nr:CDP-glycerol glycerophosphotransferase family protein [Acidobacteriota bacterium]